MTTLAEQFGSRTPVTITIASLGNGSLQESNSVDNSSNLFVDAIADGKIMTGTSPTVNATIVVYVWGTSPGGDKPGGVTGSNAAYSNGQQIQFQVGAVLLVSATSNVSYPFSIPSIAALFGGVMPATWGFVVLNNTGVALNSTGANHEIQYTGVKYTNT
jgi:hypothetical protein